MPEVNTTVTTLAQAVFAGIPRAAAYVYRVDKQKALDYLTRRFPNMPADEVNATFEFCRKARQAGIDLTSGGTPDIPVVSGVFLRTERKVMYHVWQPIVNDNGVRKHGKTDITSVWVEEP